MKESRVSCDNCWQPCCDNRFVRFGFTHTEVEMMKNAGADIHRAWWMIGIKPYYILKETCPFLENGKCQLHGKPEQPGCCQRNKAGEKFCLKMRQQTAVLFGNWP